MSHLYVCHFSNGCIKVGRSISPVARVVSHAGRVSCVGVDLTESKIFRCSGSYIAAERDLIAACASAAREVRGNEWFFGIRFADACVWAAECAAKDYVVATVAMPAIERSIPDGKRYAYVDGTWLDASPDEPHWPESAVMRWDSNPDGWHLIWPELVTHPCAIYFAPKHPLRDGPRRFADWVRSWPEGYNVETDWPAMHAQVLRFDPSLLLRRAA